MEMFDKVNISGFKAIVWTIVIAFPIAREGVVSVRSIQKISSPGLTIQKEEIQ
jgi:hypothetical protein